jgi:YfiH family protein
MNRRLSSEGAIKADGAVTNQANEVLAVMTADCLPIFFSNQAGDVIGVAHAGWRGLCAGVLENTVTEMLKLDVDMTPNQIMAWMGPAIGPEAFEVGEDVYAAFLSVGIAFPSNAFVAIPSRPGKYFANLYQLARFRLASLGVEQIYGGNFCTVTDQKRFFSHRRDAISGRFASLIWFTQ